MRPLHIIMPMAGEGSRFLNKGYKIPKPLITFKGKALFERAISSVESINAPKKFSFIVRQEHIDEYEIDKKIKDSVPQADIFSVKKTTRGAVETCFVAKDKIDINDAILIMDCDLEFKCHKYDETLTAILNKRIEDVDGGLLVSFNASEPRYSYAEIDGNYNVIRTAEKEVISDHALCGAYFFSKAEGFLTSAYELLHETDFSKPELYVSLLYNYLLKKRENVKLVVADKYYSFGTPEELKRCESYFR